MKLYGIGDLFIPHKYIREGFVLFEERGVSVETEDWRLSGFQELQHLNSLVEQSGSDAFEPPDYVFEAAKDATIVITQFCPITRKLIDHCPDLKIIGTLRAGLENVNVAHAKQQGIVLYNTPGRNADAVADFTIGMMISECRNIARGHHGLKQGEWIRVYPNSGTIPDIPGKTIGIIGLGEIGRKVVQRLKGFEVILLGHDPYLKEPLQDVQMVDLEELAENSDIVTVHARLTEDSKKMIGKAFFTRMKPTAYFINTSRSALVDEEALFEALRNNTIAGAALDVFDKEPPGRNYPLVTLENVTLTPHMAGGSNDAFYNSPRKLAAEMIKIWEGEKSRYMVNDEAFDEVVSQLRSSQ